MTQAQARQDNIADAALRVLGQSGARGLTHRAVDLEAGLPPGSTSYYCRRRVDLLALALKRHAARDRLELEALAQAFQARRSGRRSQAEALGWLASALHRWVSAHDSVLLAARFELFLAISREPDLVTGIRDLRRAFALTLSEVFVAAGARPSKATTAQVIAYLEGLLLERIRLGETVASASQLRTTLLAMLGADQA